MERQSKRSKKTKSKSRTRATSTSRNRKLKGGTNNSEIKEKIKGMIGYKSGNKNFDMMMYRNNYAHIYNLWRPLTDEQKEKFGKEFIQVARYNPFVNHNDRIEVYKTIIDDLRASDIEISKPGYLRGSLIPKSVKSEDQKLTLKIADDQLKLQIDQQQSRNASNTIPEEGSIGIVDVGGKSRRRRRHRRSSKKYKKARKSRCRMRS